MLGHLRGSPTQMFDSNRRQGIPQVTVAKKKKKKKLEILRETRRSSRKARISQALHTRPRPRRASDVGDDDGRRICRCQNVVFFIFIDG